MLKKINQEVSIFKTGHFEPFLQFYRPTCAKPPKIEVLKGWEMGDFIVFQHIKAKKIPRKRGTK